MSAAMGQLDVGKAGIYEIYRMLLKSRRLSGVFGVSGNTAWVRAKLPSERAEERPGGPQNAICAPCGWNLCHGGHRLPSGMTP
jgi:hypothetical protein